MALSRGHRYGSVNYWPGFVDALSTMLLVIIFLLSVFMLAQFFLSREVTGKDTALARLNRQIEELTSLLALERSQKSEDQTKIATLSATLEASQTERQRLLDAASQGGASADAASDKASAAANALDAQRQISAR
ncbi:MAG TPA: peptidoglycan-binding protein, partial [Roseiarcus sp.]|nr:peptidoglycan-binding protein [Roseiarcus sp.]